MLELFASPEAWASLLTLTALEIVLGIDNVIFISIVASKLPEAQRARARLIGLSLALGMRVLLLASIVWIIGLQQPLFTLFGTAFSWRDIILIAGGIFLLAKGTHEIHNEMEGEHGGGTGAAKATFGLVILQIVLLDLVFSIDSVITAIGLAEELPIMIAAVVIAMAVMLFAAAPVSDFIHRHPTAKMLALSFLLLIGAALIADGFHFHIPRGYIYFAIAFSLLVEVLNILASSARRRGKKPVEGTARAGPAAAQAPTEGALH